MSSSPTSQPRCYTHTKTINEQVTRSAAPPSGRVDEIRRNEHLLPQI